MTTKSVGRPRSYLESDTHRSCRICLQNLPVEEFNPNRIKSNGYLNIETRCIACMRAAKYGATRKVIEDLYAKQNDLCAICNKALSEGKVHIDHCHSTGKIRGILCQHCNIGLGYFFDNPDFLAAAVEYLS